MPEKYTELAQSRGLSPTPERNKKTTVIIIAIILIGISIIGVVLLLNSKSDEQTEEPTTETEVQDEAETEVEEEEQEEVEEVDVTEKKDSSGAEGDPTENFSSDTQSVGNEELTDAKLKEFEYVGYDNYLRIIFTVETDDGFPSTEAKLKASSNLIELTIAGLSEDTSGIKPGNGADVSGSVVASIFHKVTSEPDTSFYQIGIRGNTRFYLHTLDNPKRIVLDIEEQEIENGNGDEFEFSQDSQSFEGNATGNEVYIEGISHSNQGDVYRVIFRLGTIGTGNIPSSTAEIVDYEGGKAIKLEINNLYDDYIGKNTYDADYGDKAVSGGYGTYSSHVSTYYIKITSLRDYKLYYSSAPAQLIVDVKR